MGYGKELKSKREGMDLTVEEFSKITEMNIDRLRELENDIDQPTLLECMILEDTFKKYRTLIK